MVTTFLTHNPIHIYNNIYNIFKFFSFGNLISKTILQDSRCRPFKYSYAFLFYIVTHYTVCSGSSDSPEKKCS